MDRLDRNERDGEDVSKQRVTRRGKQLSGVEGGKRIVARWLGRAKGREEKNEREVQHDGNLGKQKTADLEKRWKTGTFTKRGIKTKMRKIRKTAIRKEEKKGKRKEEGRERG